MVRASSHFWAASSKEERILDVYEVTGSSPVLPITLKVGGRSQVQILQCPMEKVKKFLENYLKKDLPEIRAGNVVRIYHKFKEGEKEKTSIFEGLVIARKHGKEIGATITVRKEIDGVGVEKIIPLHSPNIEKIEIIKREKVRRAKLYYLRKK